MLAKFGRSHRGNCYCIYFEKSPSNPFLSLEPRLQPENPENSKGRSEKESLFKIFWVQVYNIQMFLFFCFSSSSLLGGLNWLWTDKGVIKVFFSFTLCSTVEEGGRFKILPPHLLAFQPRHTCSSEAPFFRVFQEKKKTKDFSSLPKFSSLPVSIVLGAT